MYLDVFFQGDSSVNQHLLVNLRNSRRGLQRRKRLKEKKNTTGSGITH